LAEKNKINWGKFVMLEKKDRRGKKEPQLSYQSGRKLGVLNAILIKAHTLLEKP